MRQQVSTGEHFTERQCGQITDYRRSGRRLNLTARFNGQILTVTLRRQRRRGNASVHARTTGRAGGTSLFVPVLRPNDSRDVIGFGIRNRDRAVQGDWRTARRAIDSVELVALGRQRQGGRFRLSG